MNNEKFSKSFEAMKNAFASAIISTGVKYGERAIELIMGIKDYVIHGSHSYSYLNLVGFSESHWFVYYVAESEQQVFVFAWNVDNEKSNYKILESTCQSVNIRFLQQTRMLLVQFLDRADLIEFDLDTMQWLDHQTIPIKEEYLPKDAFYINTRISEDEKYAAMFGDGHCPVGILDIQKKKVVYTTDLIWGDFALWEDNTILVIKRDDEYNENKKSFLVLMNKDDKTIKLSCLELPSEINDVQFYPTDTKLSIDFIAKEPKHNCSLTIPFYIQ